MAGAGKKITISSKWLLAINSVTFISILAVVLDSLVLDNFFKNRLANDPNDYLIFTLVFTMPHIMASFFGFLDKDYIDYYGNKLIKGAQFIVILAIVLPLISLELTFIVFAITTMNHVFTQQSGISKSLMRGSNKFHNWWQYTGITISTILYITIYSDLINLNYMFNLLLIICCLVFTVLGILSVKASKTILGKRYFWSTFLLPITGYLFVLTGYPILAIAVPRIVHDITAFSFYIAHDQNRFNDKQTNYLYKTLKFTKLPVYILSPVVAFVFALPFLFSDNNINLFILSMFVFLFHYYTESFMWKSGSMHRKYATPI